MNPNLTEIYSNEAMNVTCTYSSLEQPVSTSTLTVTETTAGVWVYLCKVVLNNIENTSDAHSLHVAGKSFHLVPKFPISTLIVILV